jgi:hypothetical protein
MKSMIMLLSGAALCSWCVTISPVFAQSTAFTYQGRLIDNGQPANGNYDLVFSLFPASTGTNQIGGWITNSATPVSSGLFTVMLDFGPSAFLSSDRWLQLGVRANGDGAPTTLSPRQAISPAPYTLHALGSDNAMTAVMADAVVNGVYTTGTYADPSWITSLRSSKITGDIAGKASGFLGNLSGEVVGSQGATVIVSDAITTAKIANSAVTTAKLAAGAVTEGKISAAGLLVANLNADLLDGRHATSFAEKGAGPESKNVGVCNTSGTAAAWDSATGTWSSVALGGSSSALLGSGGNIAFANNAGKAAVWSMTAKTWTQVALGGSYMSLLASKGNFVVANNSGKAAAWSDATKTWTQVSLGSGYGGIAASGGNFVVANSNGSAAAWNDPAGTWSTVSLGISAFGDIAGSAGNFVVVNNSGTAAAWNHTTGAWTSVALGGATGGGTVRCVTGSDAW